MRYCLTSEDRAGFGCQVGGLRGGLGPGTLCYNADLRAFDHSLLPGVMTRRRLLSRVLPLVFVSGACALTYELAWLRELKLVFGFSTAASATVLAAFSGGLGAGAILLGRVADRAQNPLRLFALIEAGIGLSAALLPFLLQLARAVYVALGGTPAMGPVGGTALRLVLSLCAMGGPAFLMGGTLPAVARALEEPGAASRHRSALLYGINALGAFTGCLVPTFLLFEVLGTRATIWGMACLNLAIAVSANALSRKLEAAAPVSSEASVSAVAADRRVKGGLVVAAAFASGFCFFFMELVWYRMLSPLLGGTTYTFGLILAIALLGIGLGGLGYSLARERVPRSMATFGLTCVLEAFLLGIPFVLGDHVAILAEILRRGTYLGFAGQVAGWAVVAMLVVVPGSLVAGFQFPLFISLLGAGTTRLGRHVGLAYLANTSGSLVGALSGGFVLLPALGALHSWRLAVWLLAAVGLLAAATPLWSRAQPLRPAVFVPTAAVALLGGLMMFVSGPTAVWRHGGIGAGRAGFPAVATETPVKAWMHVIRRGFSAEFEGRESSIGLRMWDGVELYVNGKSDGNTLADVGSQLGIGILPSFLHPSPRDAFVVGLGSGMTAGWLAAAPTIERVDVVELEPATARIAALCRSANFDVLHHPKVFIRYGDARELLLVTRRTYDLVVSQPSNPYRTGIASLYTKEFFHAASKRLRPGGTFVQWLQGYEIDAAGLGSTLKTMRAVFPHVDLWLGAWGDLLLVAAREPQRLRVDELRARLGQNPWKAGFLYAWGATELEGVLAHFVGGERLANHIAEGADWWVNTDDHNSLEFGLARTVGRSQEKELVRELLDMSFALRAHVPALADSSTVDFGRRAELLQERLAEERRPLLSSLAASLSDRPDASKRLQAMAALRSGKPQEFLKLWSEQGEPARSPAETLALAFARAQDGSLGPADLQGDLWSLLPAERAMVQAAAALRRDEAGEAAGRLLEATRALRAQPFASTLLDTSVLRLVRRTARRARTQEALERLVEALATPLGLARLESQRERLLLDLVEGTPMWRQRCAEAIAGHEPWPAWERRFLEQRARCYRDTGHPFLARAQKDLAGFAAQTLHPLGLLLGGAEASDRDDQLGGRESAPPSSP